MQLREELHQVQSGVEGAFRRLPGVSNRPQPGQIQMSMPNPVQSTGGMSQPCKVLINLNHRISG